MFTERTAKPAGWLVVAPAPGGQGCTAGPRAVSVLVTLVKGDLSVIFSDCNSVISIVIENIQYLFHII